MGFCVATTSRRRTGETQVSEETRVDGGPVITAFKGFDKNMHCRGFQYEVGKTYVHTGDVKACHAGFHACEHPLNVFNYYGPSESRFALVELSGEISREQNGDTKIAAGSITIKAELAIPELIESAIKWVMNRCTPEGQAATGFQGAASATGFQGAALAAGEQGAALAAGKQGAALATGFRGAALATGEQGAASATGFRGAASATGNQGAASATGFRGAALATGNQGAALATGNQGAAASATGAESVAIASGSGGMASASAGCAIFLVRRDDDYRITHVFASKVGENGIRPDVFYTLDEFGKPVEA